MKTLLSIHLIFLFSFTAFSQKNKFTDNEIGAIINIALVYSKDNNFYKTKSKDFKPYKKVKKLEKIVETFQAMTSKKPLIMADRFWKKPSKNDLIIWYIIREIHHNRIDKDKDPIPNKEVVQNVLNQTIDERELLDNYYYRIRGKVAFLFNNKDLSSYDFDTDKLGLTSSVEKAIFFVNIMEATSLRFMILSQVGNFDKIFDFYKRMPTINQKPYYYYTDFSFEEFIHNGFDEPRKYKKESITRFYNILLSHFVGISDVKGIKGKEEALNLYHNSILNIPEYFKYSSSPEDLQEIYEKIGK